MRYILDFDRTLFDTDALKRTQRELFGAATYKDPEESLNGIPLHEYVFDDALDFLKFHSKDDITILSSCTGINSASTMEFQTEKLKRSGVDAFVKDVLIVQAEKSKALQKIGCDATTVFVDDMTSHLLVARDVCPHILLFRIEREETLLKEPQSVVDDTIPVVKNLYELDAMIEKL